MAIPPHDPTGPGYWQENPQAVLTDETIVTDPDTGGAKGSKLARFDLIPPDVLWQLAEHYGRGSLKYEDRNWERGYKWSLSYSAMQRHLVAWWGGEDIDAETGSHHLIATAWHCFALVFYSLHPRYKRFDDRPGSEDLAEIARAHLADFARREPKDSKDAADDVERTGPPPGPAGEPGPVCGEGSPVIFSGPGGFSRPDEIDGT